MTDNDKKLLEDAGWTVECESPFEIRHEESNSFATGWGAKVVLERILNEAAIAKKEAEGAEGEV